MRSWSRDDRLPRSRPRHPIPFEQTPGPAEEMEKRVAALEQRYALLRREVEKNKERADESSLKGFWGTIFLGALIGTLIGATVLGVRPLTRDDLRPRDDD